MRSRCDAVLAEDDDDVRLRPLRPEPPGRSAGPRRRRAPCATRLPARFWSGAYITIVWSVSRSMFPTSPRMKPDVLDLRRDLPRDAVGRGGVQDGHLDARRLGDGGARRVVWVRRTRSTTTIPPTPSTSATSAITASQRGWVTLATNCFHRGCGSSAAALHRHLGEGWALAREQALLERHCGGLGLPRLLDRRGRLDRLELHRAGNGLAAIRIRLREVALGAVEDRAPTARGRSRDGPGSPASTRAGAGRRGAARGTGAAAGRCREPRPPRPRRSLPRRGAGPCPPEPPRAQAAASSPSARSSNPTRSASGAPFAWPLTASVIGCDVGVAQVLARPARPALRRPLRRPART